MVQKNGYFTIELLSSDDALCHVFPPVEGASLVQYREITSYLDTHGFTYDAKEVNRCIFSSESQSFHVSPRNNIEYSDTMYVEVSRDKMQAVCRFYPGSTKGGKLTVKDIMSGLQTKNVIFGIKQELIMDYIENPVYCTDFILAEGVEPEEGSDGYIEYFFNTDINTKPAYNEDGTVDFHNLNLISEVKEGQLLAKAHEEDRGKAGRTVTGQETVLKAVKHISIVGGRNIRLTEDKMEAYSEVTGHATLIDGKMFVSDVYEVPADVDNSTGDIIYDGNVYVRGSVREGFVVNAKGDVVVDGTVEGAQVTAGGQIIIKRGVNGMNKGILTSNGNVIVKFIENAQVYSGGYVDTGSIIHSSVTAKSDIVVKDKKGFITGSILRSGGRVEAQTIGSAMGSSTRIEIGADPATKQRFSEVDMELRQLAGENTKILPIIKNYADQIASGIALDPKNKEYYIKLKQVIIENNKKMESLRDEFEELRKALAADKSARVVVSRDIFPGVTVVCSDISLTTKDKRSFCYLEKKNGEIVIQNL